MPVDVYLHLHIVSLDICHCIRRRFIEMYLKQFIDSLLNFENLRYA